MHHIRLSWLPSVAIILLYIHIVMKSLLLAVDVMPPPDGSKDQVFIFVQKNTMVSTLLIFFCLFKKKKTSVDFQKTAHLATCFQPSAKTDSVVGPATQHATRGLEKHSGH